MPQDYTRSMILVGTYEDEFKSAFEQFSGKRLASGATVDLFKKIDEKKTGLTILGEFQVSWEDRNQDGLRVVTIGI